MLRQDGYEDVLPVHGVDDGIGCLHARGEAREPPGGDDNPPLVQHGGEDDQHVVDAHGVVILRQVALCASEGRENCIVHCAFVRFTNQSISSAHVLRNAGESPRLRGGAGEGPVAPLGGRRGPGEAERRARVRHPGLVAGLQEAAQLAVVGGQGQLSGVVQEAVERVVPRKAGQEDLKKWREDVDVAARWQDIGLKNNVPSFFTRAVSALGESLQKPKVHWASRSVSTKEKFCTFDLFKEEEEHEKCF